MSEFQSCGWDIGDEVTNELHSKIGTVIEINDNGGGGTARVCVDWGLYTKWEPADKLEPADNYYEPTIYDDDEDPFE